MNPAKPSAATASASKIFYAGLLVGTLDILAALIKYYLSTGNNPLFIFKYIASGIFGPAAFSGGAATIAAGIVLHYIIALSFTLLFFILYRNFRVCARHKILTGIVYGIFIWMVMAFLVVPLSRTPKGPFDAGGAIKELLILVFMIGLPLSFLAPRLVRKPGPAATP